MKFGFDSALVAVCGLLLAAVPAAAHHAFGAEYDASKTIVLKGTVTRVDWLNPHVRFYLDVKDEKGVVTSWDLELQSPNSLARNGWSRHTLKVGDSIVVSAFMAKDGANRANARGSVTLSDGRKIFAGSSGDDAGPNDAK